MNKQNLRLWFTAAAIVALLCGNPQTAKATEAEAQPLPAAQDEVVEGDVIPDDGEQQDVPPDDGEQQEGAQEEDTVRTGLVEEDGHIYFYEEDGTLFTGGEISTEIF